MQPSEAPSPALRALPGPLLTVAEAASRLRVSKATVYKLCEEGQLAYVRASTHSIRISLDHLAAFIERGGPES